jgi:sialate O-acetylesterase
MPTLHPLFTDHAVIAARCPRILGTAAPEAVVTVTLAGASETVRASRDGQWTASFPPLPPGGPHTLEARDELGKVAAHDVLLGDVWLGSGQSNMEWTLGLTKGAEADIASADEPRLRIFTVGRSSQPLGPTSTLEGRWVVMTPAAAPAVSAVGYFFGRKLLQETGQPVGVVVSAWGGSPIAAWLPEEALRGRPEYGSFVLELEAARAGPIDLEADRPHADPGLAAHAANWMAAEFDDSAWQTIEVPGLWQDQGMPFNGAVWYRSHFDIPPAWIGGDLQLDLGVIDDFDRTWVNGKEVGATGTETANWWTHARSYLVPAASVRGTRLAVAVRVFDQWGGGGLLGPVALRPAGRDAGGHVAVSRPWRARAELQLPPRSPMGQLWASSLWNGMIHPLQGVGLTGVIWYQGESDVIRAALYPRLLTDLIARLRTAFAAPELPFGIVQLASFMARRAEPAEDPWADLREAQRRVAATVPACGLAVAIDAGEAEDVHPRYKRTVGERLALWALREAHDRRGEAYSGPTLAEHRRQGDGISVRFVHAEGLRVRGDALRGFQIAGSDRRWIWADAEMRGDTVLVRSPRIARPVAVRYAWQANPETTLENAAGLPASPFRTDDWSEVG